MKPTIEQLIIMSESFLNTGLWSSTDDDDNPMDDNFELVSNDPELINRIRKAVAKTKTQAKIKSLAEVIGAQKT